MNPYLLAVTVALLATSGNTAHAQGRAQGRKPAREGWLGDYEVAKELARKTGKPMMVVFRCEP
jgi:hypothetical protein